MSERSHHLRLLESPPGSIADSVARDVPGRVALFHEWRAAQIARSKAMHPSSLARAAAVPALRPLG